MVRKLPEYASIQEHIDYALSAWHKGVNKDEVLSAMKANHYIHNGRKYKAVSIVAHMELLDRLDQGARKGLIKATKAKGLTW